MKRILTICLLSLAMSARAYYVDWFTMSNYVASALSGFTPSGGSTPGISTNAPALFWTNNISTSYWLTNANFTMTQVSLASSNKFEARFIVSNSAAITITDTFPFTCYSLSMATNVVGASVPAGTALELQFYYATNGLIYVEDNGQSSPSLLSLAATVAAANGILVANNGLVTGTTNPVVWNLTVQNIETVNQLQNNYPANPGIAIQGQDTLGNVWVYVQNRNGANGLVISNATLDLVDEVSIPSSGAPSNWRFEHRGGNLFFPANSSGERQLYFGTTPYDFFGAVSSFVSNRLYTVAETTSNLTVTAGLITNGWCIYCTTTNLGPLNTNYIYMAMMTNYPGKIFVSSNTAASPSTWFIK